MIIDAHMHLPIEPALQLVVERPGEASIEAMRRSGIDKGVVLAADGWSGSSRDVNDAYADAAARFPGILYPWATVSPYYLPLEGEAEVMELRRAVTELGMCGLKMLEQMPGYMDMVMEELAHLGVPVIFHSGTPPWTTPLQLANLARRYPTVTVILGHGGLEELWSDALLAARQLDNLWIETSRVSFHGLQKMVDTLGPERIVFGSDSATRHHTMRYCIERVKALRISDQAREAILGGNMARLLGLSE